MTYNVFSGTLNPAQSDSVGGGCNRDAADAVDELVSSAVRYAGARQRRRHTRLPQRTQSDRRTRGRVAWKPRRADRTYDHASSSSSSSASENLC